MWLLSSYQLPNPTHCIDLLTVKFTQVSSGKNLIKWKLSWGWESHCADTVSCQSVVTRIFNNLPVCLIPNLSKKSYPAATVLPFAKNLPLCTVTSDEDICIWLCEVTAKQQLTLFEFWVKNLNFPPKKKVDCENLVKTLCTVTSDEDISIWLQCVMAQQQLTLFEFF